MLHKLMSGCFVICLVQPLTAADPHQEKLDQLQRGHDIKGIATYLNDLPTNTALSPETYDYLERFLTNKLVFTEKERIIYQNEANRLELRRNALKTALWALERKKQQP